MTGGPIRISGGEPGGELEIGADAVLRRLHAVPWQSVEPVLQRIPGLHDALGLVPWSQVSADESWVVLKHPRVRVISYPHEWCAEMLYDAALLHCRLLAAIAPHGMALKDAHPWNVLFDASGARFIDVGSIVPAPSLAQLDYLRRGRHDRAFEVFRLMFLPYFLVPLAFHRAGLGDRVRSVLWRLALNGASRLPRLPDYLPDAGPARLKASTKGMTAAIRTARRFRAIAGRLPATGAVGALAENTASLLAELAPLPVESGYTAYYASKGEDQSLDDAHAWNAKQRNVAAAIHAPGIDTVLDVACNTGWYARMAARSGKRVTAVDVDGACISSLYRTVRAGGEDVVPLVADIAALSPDRGRQGGGLLLISAERRLRSDVVLALGILHHLVLGAGLKLAEALRHFSALASRRLVVEFVGLDDDMVRGQPGFFPAMVRDPGGFGHFTLDATRNCLADLGWKVAVHASHPSTRSLLVCSRAGD